MKKFSFILCAAALALASTFTACSNEDTSVYPDGIVIRNGYKLDSIYAQALAKATGDEITIQLPAGVEVFMNGDIEVEEGYKLTIIGDAAKPAKVNMKGGFITSNSIVIKNVDFAINESVNVPFIKLNMLPEEGLNEKGSFEIDEITLDGVKIDGLKYQLVSSDRQQYLIKKVTVNNSTVAIKGGAKGKSLIQFANNGNALEITISNSTIWADAKSEWQNGGLFSTQSGKEVTDLSEDEDATWTFTLTNNTFYNIAYKSTVNTLRKNNQSYHFYVITDNKIVNCGKKGQFLKGLVAGQNINKPENWTASGNIINFDGEDIAETENACLEGACVAGIVDVTPFDQPAEE